MCEEERGAGPIRGAGPKAEIEVDVDAIHGGFLKDACCLKDVHMICLEKKRKEFWGSLENTKEYLSLDKGD